MSGGNDKVEVQRRVQPFWKNPKSGENEARMEERDREQWQVRRVDAASSLLRYPFNDGEWPKWFRLPCWT